MSLRAENSKDALQSEWQAVVRERQQLNNAVIAYTSSLQALLTRVENDTNVSQAWKDAAKAEIQAEWDQILSDITAWVNAQPADLTP